MKITEKQLVIMFRTLEGTLTIQDRSDVNQFGYDRKTRLGIYNQILNQQSDILVDIENNERAYNPIADSVLGKVVELLENNNSVSDNVFNKAVEYAQERYSTVHLDMPYMLLGDVAELIKITTGKEIDWNVLAKYSK